jgi:hypothetical protein
MFAVGLVALMAGLASSPFDEPALFLLTIALTAFFLFSLYVLARVPFIIFIIFPRACPTCHRLSLTCKFSDTSRPLGDVRECRRCGVTYYRGWSGPWLALPDFNDLAKPQSPGHPLADEVP